MAMGNLASTTSVMRTIARAVHTATILAGHSIQTIAAGPIESARPLLLSLPQQT